MSPTFDTLFARPWRPSGFTDEPGYPEDGDPVELMGRLRVPVGFTDNGEPIYEDAPSL